MKKTVSPLIAGLLLLIIYLTYASLGLPDSLLSSGWNLIRSDLNVELGALGFMTFLGYFSSAISAYLSPKIMKILQTKWITFITISVIGTSLIIMSQVQAFYQLLFFAFPLGFSGGALNVSLNNFLASNYQASHMNYLHSFYGLGVTVAPTIMAYTLSLGSWRLAYIIVGLTLLMIALMVLLTIKWWDEPSKENKDNKIQTSASQVLKSPKVINSIIIFFIYVHVESLFAVWIPSYMFITKQVSLSTAALFPTIFYVTLTSGRMLSGIFANRLKSSRLVAIGVVLTLIAILLLNVSPNNITVYFIITGILGFGTSPIYPSMMALNRDKFGKEMLARVISLQLLIGNMGGGLLTPIMGQIFQRTSITFLPLILAFASIVLVVATYFYLRKKVTIS